MVSATDIRNARILIVDDKEANVRLLERMLRVAGYACVESTTDPSVVCELHRKNRYSLILLDLQMPGMDGFQVMEGLKEIEADGYLPVLVITAQPATSCARSKPAPRILSASRLTWPSCARGSTTCWKSACCTWSRTIAAMEETVRSSNEPRSDAS